MREATNKHPWAPFAAVVSAVLACSSFGQTAVWTGTGANENYTTPANWQGGTVPGNTGTTTLDFDLGLSQRTINLNSAVNVAGIYFSTPSAGIGYTFQDGGGSLTIGSGGISFQSGVDSYFDFFAPVVLSASPVVANGGSTYYTAFYNNISETGGARNLTVNGRVYLFGNNTFSGGLTVLAGTAYLGSSTAAGTGTIVADDNSSLQSTQTVVNLANPVSLGNDVTFGNFYFSGTAPQLTFSGPVTLQNMATTVYLNSNTSVDLQGTLTGPSGSTVSVSGQGSRLPYDGGSQLVIEGSTSNVNSISVLNAALILAPTGSPNASFSSIGASGLTIGNSDQPGYLGLDGAFSSVPGSVSTFLSTYGTSLGGSIGGTLGFDTFANPTAPNTFNDPINLSGFSSTYFTGLGSQSSAILGPAAVITPYGQLYKFGGGGGTLTVQSPLADSGGATALVVSSGSEPLSLILQGSNTYTGGTTVNGGALIFDSALPGTGSITVAPGAYVGSTENSGLANAQAFLIAVSVTGPGAIIGFDSSNVASPRPTITDAIDVSVYGENAPFIGTATKVTLGGTINPDNNAYQFTGIKGGNLTIASNLVGAGVSATFGLPNPVEANGSTSIINITGTANTYGGGTTFNSGTLFILSGSGLGAATAPVTIPDTGTYTSTPYFAPFGGTVTIPNPISVGNLSSQPGVSFGNAYSADMLVLSGVISDASMPGIVGIVGPVTLSGANTYTGGTVISSNNGGYTSVTVTNPSSLGTGPLVVDYYGASLLPSGGDVTLPNDIYLYNSLILGKGGSANRLILNGVISGGGNLDIESNVGLGGLNTFSGGTIVNNANVLISSTSPFGTGTLDLNNSTLSYGTASPTFVDLEGDTNGVIAMGSGSTVTLSTDLNSSSYTYGGAINGDGTVALVKSGSGVEFLTGTSTYGGGTTISGGTLVAGSNQALGSGPVTVTPGTTLGVGSGATVSNTLTLGAGSTLAGNGTFAAAAGVTFSSGTIVSPGNIPGQEIAALTFSNSVTLGSSGSYVFNISDAGGAAGVGYGTVNIGGTLTVTSIPTAPFVVNLVSLDPGSGNPGLATFSATSSYSWTLLSAASVSGFAAGDFTLNTSGFQNPTLGGVFSFAQNGNSLDLNFTPVPEPSTWILIAWGAGALAFQGYRKRRSSDPF